MEVYHQDKNGMYVCRQESGKTQILKWFCLICHRYVLPDGKKHWSRIKVDKVKELELALAGAKKEIRILHRDWLEERTARNECEKENEKLKVKEVIS